MHKNDLIAILEKVEGNPEIYVDIRSTNFKYGLVNSAKVKTIKFSEEPGGVALAEDKVVVISEE